MKIIYVGLYLAMMPLANWMVSHVGMCLADGPCVVPVGFGLYAPSGVLLVGLALCLRDLVQEHCGRVWAYGAIAAGAVLSALASPLTLAVASTVAFIVSELLDMQIFTRLRDRSALLAVLGSGVVGLALDSFLFLLLAFGSLRFLEGQMLGKMWAVIVFGPVSVWMMRVRVIRIGQHR